VDVLLAGRRRSGGPRFRRPAYLRARPGDTARIHVGDRPRPLRSCRMVRPSAHRLVVSTRRSATTNDVCRGLHRRSSRRGSIAYWTGCVLPRLPRRRAPTGPRLLTAASASSRRPPTRKLVLVRLRPDRVCSAATSPSIPVACRGAMARSPSPPRPGRGPPRSAHCRSKSSGLLSDRANRVRPATPARRFKLVAAVGAGPLRLRHRTRLEIPRVLATPTLGSPRATGICSQPTSHTNTRAPLGMR